MITLIFVDRAARLAYMVVIRRELPQTGTALKKALQDWMNEAGDVTLEMDLQPIVDQIDAAME